MGELPTVVSTGTFTLFGVEVKCHVLDNGQRIIDADDMATLFSAMGQPDAKLNEDDIEAFARWSRGLE